MPFQPAHRPVHAIINANQIIAAINVDMPAFVIGQREQKNIAFEFVAHFRCGESLTTVRMDFSGGGGNGGGHNGFAAEALLEIFHIEINHRRDEERQALGHD
jgi:hypothetical protein